jgi:hypothetical protein
MNDNFLQWDITHDADGYILIKSAKWPIANFEITSPLLTRLRVIVESNGNNVTQSKVQGPWRLIPGSTRGKVF